MMLRLIIVLLVLALGGCAKPPPAPIVILIGLDGFRWDYLEKFHPPTLSRLARDGVRAESMQASFPTLTFPNFYTLATGLRPEHHGIVSNTMFDPVFNATFSLGSPAVQDGRWWGGEPLWVTAEKQGVRSACMFWPGSEAEISGRRPSDWRPFQLAVTPEERVQTVLDWLARPPNERPRLITLYFHEADTAGHRTGLEGPEIAQAVKILDDSLAHLLDGIRQPAPENAVNVRMDPTDRSMLPIRITTVDAVARMSRTEDCRRMLRKFSCRRNRLSTRENAMMSSSSVAIGAMVDQCRLAKSSRFTRSASGGGADAGEGCRSVVMCSYLR